MKELKISVLSVRLEKRESVCRDILYLSLGYFSKCSNITGVTSGNNLISALHCIPWTGGQSLSVVNPVSRFQYYNVVCLAPIRKMNNLNSAIRQWYKEAFVARTLIFQLSILQRNPGRTKINRQHTVFHNTFDILREQ